MSVIRSCWADGLNHVGSVCQMNTGSILAGRPSLGAWVTYGLGTANRESADLRRPDRRPGSWSADPKTGARDSCRRPIRERSSAQGDTPILDLKPPRRIDDEQQRSKLDLLSKLNEHFGDDKQEDTELDARIERVRTGVPDAVGRRPRRST